MHKMLCSAAALALLGFSVPALAQPKTPTYATPADVTMPAPPVAVMGLDSGTNAKCFLGSSTTCVLPTSVHATGTFDDAAIGATGDAVPASASLGGLNVAGTMQAQTGVNPSGSIYAGQVDLTSVGGVSLLRGNGVTGTGSPRVTIASDNTPFHIIVDSAPTTAVNQAGNSFSNIITATTTAVKSSAGTLHTVCVNALGTVASTATLYDNTSASGTKIATLNTLAFLGCSTYDVAFTTGLTIVTPGTAAPDLTISFR